MLVTEYKNEEKSLMQLIFSEWDAANMSRGCY